MATVLSATEVARCRPDRGERQKTLRYGCILTGRLVAICVLFMLIGACARLDDSTDRDRPGGLYGGVSGGVSRP